jgi:hypothetical protein
MWGSAVGTRLRVCACCWLLVMLWSVHTSEVLIPSLGLAAFVACGLTVISHSTFPGPESSHPFDGWWVPVFYFCCSLDAQTCRWYSAASFTISRADLSASLTDFAEVEVGVGVYPQPPNWTAQSSDDPNNTFAFCPVFCPICPVFGPVFCPVRGLRVYPVYVVWCLL